MHACVRICMEVDLEKGLPEAIKIKVDQWMHIQQLITSSFPSNVRYVMSMVILQIDVVS